MQDSTEGISPSFLFSFGSSLYDLIRIIKHDILELRNIFQTNSYALVCEVGFTMDQNLLNIIFLTAGSLASLISIFYALFNLRKRITGIPSQTARAVKENVAIEDDKIRQTLLETIDSVRAMRSFQESLEKPLKQERQELREIVYNLSDNIKILKAISSEFYDYTRKSRDSIAKITDISENIEFLISDLDKITITN